ncbi:trypsin-like [Diprion similis]|uniref:trypsin-like n=1 Tax=Diprion similis TaxID=362088 RepID=UPI001EF9099E|nr:trypsin-like [Diprion similis]
MQLTMSAHHVNRFLSQGLTLLLLVNIVGVSSSEQGIHLTIEHEPEGNQPRQLGRIVNGSQALLGQFSHQVSLRYSWMESHFCGGSIIDAQWILTAAHCMFLQTGAQIQPWMVSVVAGDLWLNRTSSTSQRRTVAQIIIHEDYNSVTYENDITLLRLGEPLIFENSAVQYQTLQSSTVAAGTKCQVAGWGYPAIDILHLMNELMYVEVPIVSQTQCRKLYAEFSDIPDGMICAGYIEGLRDACQGDSGGGLICGGVLTGVVSSGNGCAWPGFPGIYTDVKHYREWVLRWSGIEERTVGASALRSLSTSTALLLLIAVSL